jgi:hydrogenase maturation factor
MPFLAPPLWCRNETFIDSDILTSGLDPRFLATAVIVAYHVLELKSIPSIVESLQEGHYG